MHIFTSFFFVIIFVAELTLDSSTTFVRSSTVSYSVDDDGAASTTDSTEPTKATKPTRISVEGLAHSALPVVVTPAAFWKESTEVNSFADILFLYLNPPASKIDRPPIC